MRGSLDEAKLEQLGGDLIKQLNDTTEERVILDFRNVQFMSSSMLGKLVQLQKKCKEFKVHLKLCCDLAGHSPGVQDHQARQALRDRGRRSRRPQGVHEARLVRLGERAVLGKSAQPMGIAVARP